MNESMGQFGAPDARVRYLADALPQLVWMANADGVVEYYNSRAAEYAGIESTPAGSWEWRPGLHPDDLDRTVRAWTDAVRTGTTYQCEHRVRMADGSFRWHLSRGVPVLENGRVVQWFGTATDIEQVKRAEQELHEAARNKDEFLALVAHELRNPLAPICNSLELMRTAPLDPQVRRLHGILDRQVSQMVRLVDDLLEISRISRGELRLDLQPVVLVDVLDSAVEAMEAAIAGGAQRLHRCELPRSVIVDGDAVRLSQAFGNLLHNAVKFSPAGGAISLTCDWNADTVSVQVRDWGAGIAPHMLEPIFEMFVQGDPSGAAASGAAEPIGFTKRGGGLGIGLALVRRIVELHRGEVTASSEGIGRGSTFTVTLPRRSE